MPNAVNPLLLLAERGQSPWFDGLSRSLILSGRLAALIQQDGVRGVTSNPTIFEKAIASADYAPALRQAATQWIGVKAIYETLAVRDIQDAADLLRPVYEQSGGQDGYVSLEVSPALAHDTDGAIGEAMRLFDACHRDNVMIKIPATDAGLPAIEALIARGINVNITLLFDVAMYTRVALAYLSGLEKAHASGRRIASIASVASFFISRIDTVVDRALRERAAADSTLGSETRCLLGQIAIANAKRAYRQFQAIFSTPRFAALKAQGARAQRLLWASTGTKDPAYPSTYYVEALIGPETVNTMPEATLAAFRDHGKDAVGLLSGGDEADDALRRLSACGVDLDGLTRVLLAEGIDLFDASFRKLMETLSRKRQAILGDALPQVALTLGALDLPVAERLKTLSDFPRALWRKDARLWGRDAGTMSGLGWLDLPEWDAPQIAHVQALAESVRAFRHLVLLGMGGSSLAVAVFRKTFGVVAGRPRLHVLDHPSDLLDVERRVDLSQTLVLVSSKSGTTLETRLMLAYFLERMRQTVGAAAGQHFVAITDAGSPLETQARAAGFLTVLHGATDVGGRYSALSPFGIAPAAMMGVDVASLLRDARRMRHSNEADVPPEAHPALCLGVTLIEAALRGRDKATFILSPALDSLGPWLEQLIAESLGKAGRGIVPIVGEPLGAPAVYGADRIFVHIQDAREGDPARTRAVACLAAAGHPVIEMKMGNPLQIGQAFYLWEMATAAAGALLGVHPFDQPAVEEGKTYTRERLKAFIKTGRLPEETPALITDGMRLYGKAACGAATLDAALSAHLAERRPNDYVALTVYLSEIHAGQLGEMRRCIRDATCAATTLGFGPRYLHAIGQLYQDGPNTGLFIQITADDVDDLAIPGESYTFGTVSAAQAAGDFECLQRRGRRVLRVHLGRDVTAGLARLQDAIERALEVSS